MSFSLDMILTVIILSSWFIPPLCMFLSIGQLDKKTDQNFQLQQRIPAQSFMKDIGKTLMIKVRLEKYWRSKTRPYTKKMVFRKYST